MTLSATREGVILGTAAYISPAQTPGQVIDKRTDIWASHLPTDTRVRGAAWVGKDRLIVGTIQRPSRLVLFDQAK